MDCCSRTEGGGYVLGCTALDGTGKETIGREQGGPSA